MNIDDETDEDSHPGWYWLILLPDTGEWLAMLVPGNSRRHAWERARLLGLLPSEGRGQVEVAWAVSMDCIPPLHLQIPSFDRHAWHLAMEEWLDSIEKPNETQGLVDRLTRGLPDGTAVSVMHLPVGAERIAHVREGCPGCGASS